MHSAPAEDSLNETGIERQSRDFVPMYVNDTVRKFNTCAETTRQQILSQSVT